MKLVRAWSDPQRVTSKTAGRRDCQQLGFRITVEAIEKECI